LPNEKKETEEEIILLVYHGELTGEVEWKQKNFMETKLSRNWKGRIEFCRKLKTPRTLTIPKDGSPYGSVPYAPWDKFTPGGSKK